MLKEREILNKESIVITIERLCHQLIEGHNTFDNTVLIGVQPRGTYLNNRILFHIIITYLAYLNNQYKHSSI